MLSKLRTPENTKAKCNSFSWNLCDHIETIQICDSHYHKYYQKAALLDIFSWQAKKIYHIKFQPVDISSSFVLPLKIISIFTKYVIPGLYPRYFTFTKCFNFISVSFVSIAKKRVTLHKVLKVKWNFNVLSRMFKV